MLVDKMGGLYACGSNKHGQLGLRNNVNQNRFTCVELAAGIAIQHVVCSDSHTIFFDKKGRMYACGKNNDGQLGLGDNENRNTFKPVKLAAGIEIQHVVCGRCYTMLLDKNGRMHGCGHSGDGQLGLGDNKNQNTFTPAELAAGIVVQHVVCGAFYTMLLDKNGGVYACGRNWYGQLGLGNNESRNTFECVQEGLPRWGWKNVSQHNTASRESQLEEERPLVEESLKPRW